MYVIDKKQSKKQLKEQEANQKRTSQLASSQNSASAEQSENVTSGSKSQAQKKSTTPSGPKNKLIDMVKQSFTSKLASSSALSSGSNRQKDSQNDGQDYEGGQTRGLQLRKQSSVPDQAKRSSSQGTQNFAAEAPAPRHASLQAAKEPDPVTLGQQNQLYQMKY